MASEQRHRCEECGGELTCCGPMTEDGPLLDCLLCQRSEIITKLKAQLAASDGRVMVAETMLADFYHRAKDCDKDSRSPVDSVPPIVVVRHIVWQYETAFRKATDAAKALEG